MERNVQPATGTRRGASRHAEIAARLEALRNELVEEYEQCGAELRSAIHVDSDDEDGGEGSYTSVAYILQHLSAEIRDVDDALERLKAGQYGVCVNCGAPIGAHRLRAIPTARRCLNCQAGTERKVG
jgi:DnaK suppressor protein